MTPAEQLHQLTDQIADALDADDYYRACDLNQQARRLHPAAYAPCPPPARPQAPASPCAGAELSILHTDVHATPAAHAPLPSGSPLSSADDLRADWLDDVRLEELS